MNLAKLAKLAVDDVSDGWLSWKLPVEYNLTQAVCFRDDDSSAIRVSWQIVRNASCAKIVCCVAVCVRQTKRPGNEEITMSYR